MATAEGHLRASDAERDAVIAALGRHTADGRLTMEEFEERVAEALAATTRDDLRPVLRELPASQPPIAEQAQARRRPAVPSRRGLLTTMAVVLAVVMVMNGVWWIVFPLLGVFGGCGRRGFCGSRRDLNDLRRPTDVETHRDRELIRV